MAYFRAMSSASGVTATITVTYDSTLYNKTMTCTNGTKTYTKTTTSSGSTTFNVYEEGTWTITCNDVSKTVNVVFNYTTQMYITKTVTVYGASGATISFSDTTGSKTVTLNSSGEGHVSITFIPNQSITFTDTNVAKNPDNLSQNYSKAITITSSTTSIKVMPDGAIYWYGNKTPNGGIEGNAYWTITNGRGIISNKPVWNTNNVDISAPTTAERNNYVSIQSVNSFNNTLYKKVCAYMDIGTTKVDLTSNLSKIIVQCVYSYASGHLWTDITTIKHNTTVLKEWSTHSTKVYALWLE